MFEKEAEEYAQDMTKYYESAHGSIPSQFEKYLRKAVEFGYNKANEWKTKFENLQKYLDTQNCYRECAETWQKNKELQEQIEKMKSDSKTAYIKGIRTMANALKKYDREEGAWTDYFEHTVDKVLKNLLKEFSE